MFWWGFRRHASNLKLVFLLLFYLLKDNAQPKNIRCYLKPKRVVKLLEIADKDLAEVSSFVRRKEDFHID
jgi:hypothetical protein